MRYEVTFMDATCTVLEEAKIDAGNLRECLRGLADAEWVPDVAQISIELPEEG